MLDNLKLMLGIAADDTDLNEKLKLIIANTTARLRLLLGGIDVPEEMDHIVLEVAIVRFNRIGAEGMASHSVEGESSNYTDDDFKPYAGEIQAYLDTQKTSARGKVKFI